MKQHPITTVHIAGECYIIFYSNKRLEVVDGKRLHCFTFAQFRRYLRQHGKFPPNAQP